MFATAVTRARDFGRLVAFSHSIFALPFALQGAWLAGRAAPAPRTLALLVVAAVAARTAAMATNRIVDRRIDARNPRTRGRELPAGRVSTGAASALALIAAGIFFAAAFLLNRMCGLCAPAVLAVLVFYSFTKRFTWACHFVLGLSLGLAPPAAWLAVRGAIDGDALAPLVLGAAVLTWVAGFDVIYACQDAEFDRGERLHSIPARFGVRRALVVARILHVLTVLFLLGFAHLAGLGPIYHGAIALAGLLLVYEHRVVRADDLSRVNLAFFTLNGWIGVGLFAGLWLDLAT